MRILTTTALTTGLSTLAFALPLLAAPLEARALTPTDSLLVRAARLSDWVFDDRRPIELRLSFSQPAFWDSLYENYEEGEYLSATLTFEGRDYEDVGVRFKGASSMWGFPTEKKPFKIKFDAFNEEQTFFGLTKLSLSNGFRDPSFLREKLFYDAVGEFLPCGRANFAKLYINDVYWGLYTNVEQVDKRQIQRHFGGNEDGNLFKGDPQGWLVWLGPEWWMYDSKYKLVTNEAANNWNDLIDLIDRIDNSSIAGFPDELEPAFHIRNFLFLSVLYNLYITLDSYIGEGHNYYLYHRDDTDRFTILPWDGNEAFAACPAYVWPDLLELPLFWERSQEHPRPLVNKMFDIQEYRDIYLMDYQHVVENHFDETRLFARIDKLAASIRSAVYADTLKMYSDQEFEQNLSSDTWVHGELFYGLKSFITGRLASVSEQLDQEEIPARRSGLFVNELMASNQATIQDEWGEYDDWIEIYNSNATPVNLEGLLLTDNPQTPDKWELPSVEIGPQEFLLIWADGDTAQGALHADFKLAAGGEYVGLYERDGVIPIDTVSFGAQSADISYGRFPDGGAGWVLMGTPTPGTSNVVGMSAAAGALAGRRRR